jgi:hypothetical protein
MITEERIATLEEEIRKIKLQLPAERKGVIGRTNPLLIEELLSKSPQDKYTDSVWHSIEHCRDKERKEVRKEK